MTAIFLDIQGLIVNLINVLAINEEVEDEIDIVEVIENAKDYFPTETWDMVRYLGRIRLEHDVKIAMNEESLGAFLFERLLERIEKIRSSSKPGTLLLGLTSDPIIGSYIFFDGKNFKKISYVVHDYMNENVGVVSLFRVEQEKLSEVVAHGLGHNKGLRHHVKPVDLMHPELLRFQRIKLGFCRFCLQKLSQE